MTVLDALRFLIGAKSSNALIELLNGLKRAVPDSAAKIDEVLAMFGAAATPSNLANVAAAITRELGDIAQGHFDRRGHASDSA